MNKIAFTFIAISILLSSSFIPFGNAIATQKEKTIEVPVQIYALQGVKKIKKKLPVEEVEKLKEKAYNAAKAISTLHDKSASFMEKMKANAIIDSFLYEMKRNGLLGSMSVEEAKELITGKYVQEQRMEMQKLKALAKFFQQNGWEINAMCGMYAEGIIVDVFPWNAFWVLCYIDLFFEFAGWIWFIFDTIPHATTIGIWKVSGRYYTPGEVITFGLLGRKNITGMDTRLITLGFTGVVFPFPWRLAIGFCPFVAMKEL